MKNKKYKSGITSNTPNIIKVRYVIFSITVMTKFLFIGIFVSLSFVSSFSRSI